ncbi:hypothetical protein HFD88_005465 [Aspergillus terreus]|nr:hypothetical protein HFD88_005465 [Aspergillus terreus]
MGLRKRPLTAHLAFFAFLLLQVVIPISAQLCYNPNGSISNDRPCNSSADVSVCCEDGFVCTENKLCQPMGWYDGSDGNPLQLIRGTCTDKTWKSGNCPGHCIAGVVHDPVIIINNVRFIDCDDELGDDGDAPNPYGIRTDYSPSQSTHVWAMKQSKGVAELDSRDPRVFSELQGKPSHPVYEVE